MFFVACFSVPLAELKPEPCQQNHRTGLDRRHNGLGYVVLRAKQFEEKVQAFVDRLKSMQLDLSDKSYMYQSKQFHKRSEAQFVSQFNLISKQKSQ